MTTDSHDPRIGTILQLVSRLSDQHQLSFGETPEAVGDEMDRVIERLTALVEAVESGDTSRDFLLSITDSMLDIMIITDLDGQITMVNRAACRILGCPAKELLGQAVNSLFAEPIQLDISNEHVIDEKTVVAKDGRRIPVSCSRSQLRNDQGQPVGFTCIAQDITDRKQTEKTLEMFQYSIDQATDAIIWLTEDAGFSYVNEQACRSLGYTREELMRLKLWDIDPIYPKERYETMWTYWRQDRRGGDEHLETLRRRKDGTLFPVEVSSKHLWFGDQALHVAVCRDITERKQEEQELLLTQFSVDHASVGIVRTGSEAQILSVNQHYCQLVGYTAEELCQMHVYDLDPAYPPERWKAHSAYIRRQGSDIFETAHRRKDGTTIPVEVTTTYVTFQEHEYSISFIHDISERKQMLEELRRKSFAVERALDAIYAIDEDAYITDANESACLMTGYSREELVGLPITAIDPKETLAEVKARLKQIQKEGTVFFETQNKTKEGRVFPVEVAVSHIAYEGKAILYAYIRDITERKRMLEELRLKSFAVERASDAVYWIDEQTLIADVNEAACRLFGYTREEFIGLPIAAIDPTLSQDEILAIWQKIAREGSLAFESQHQTKAGHIFPVEVVVSHVSHGDKALNCAFARDITDRKRTEAIIEESRAVLNATLESMQDGLLVITEDRQVSHFNTRFCQMWAIPEDLLIGATDQVLIDYVLRQLAEPKQFAARIAKVYQVSDISEDSLHLKDGRIFELVSYPLVREGQDTGRVWMFRDITKRKQAEEALRLSNFALERSSIAVHWVDPTGRIIDVNDAACRMLGYTREEFAGMSLRDIDPVFNLSDMSAVWEDVKKGPPIIETWHRAKDGRLIPVEITANYITFEGKELNCAFARDITERKQVEEVLRQSEVRYRALIESQSDLISRYLPDTTLTFVNDAYCQFYGKTREELIGQSFLITIAPGFREAARQETESLIKDPRLVSGEYLNYAADGRECWIQWIIQPIADENDQVVELQAVGRDITQIKETEAALRESEFFLQKSQEVALIGSYYLDISTGNWISSPMLDEILGIDDQFSKDIEGWIALIHPAQQAEMRYYLNKYVLANRNRFDKVYRIVKRDSQQERWIYGLGELEFDEQGNPVKMIGTLQDVTERKQIEDTLHESENRFSVIFNESADLQLIASVEPDGTFRGVAFNNRYLEVVKLQYGISEQDLVGKTILEIWRDVLGFEKRAYTLALDNCNLAVRTGQVIRYDETLNTPLGPFLAESVIAPVFGTSNECRYIIYSARDITERKKAEEEIRQLNEELEQRVIERTKELEEANEEIRHFAYIVSHDLRAPLVNLKGFAAELRAALKVLEQGCDDVFSQLDPATQTRVTQSLREDIPEALRFIESSVNNMDTFTKAILRLSRLGRLQLELVEIDVRSLVEKLLETLQYQINQQGTEVTIGGLPVIVADLVSIEQIFGNILNNAIMYLDRDRPGEIAISAEYVAGDTVFHIWDNGRGIAAEDMDKVFAPFRRAGKQEVPGEGMGLAYVQTLVRRHGGRIWCESEVGVGTTFSFTIPRDLRETL